MAQVVWRRVWGVTCLLSKEGRATAARWTCLMTSCCTASELSRPFRTVGNSGAERSLPLSLSHARTTATVAVVSGVHFCFRPLPRHRTLAPLPSWTSAQVSPVSSETRSPVWMATASSV